MVFTIHRHKYKEKNALERKNETLIRFTYCEQMHGLSTFLFIRFSVV